MGHEWRDIALYVGLCGRKKDMKEKLEERAKKLKMELGALFFACKRKDAPFLAKLLAGMVVAYALSPIDLIPDFVPVLGYLDDLILLPFGIFLALKLIPPDIMEECRKQSEDFFAVGKKKNYGAAAVIVVLWILILVGVLKLIF